MSELETTEEKARRTEELKKIDIFSDLSAQDLAWLADNMEEVSYAAGEAYGKPGDPFDHMIILLDGEAQIERPDMPGNPLFTLTPGHVTGLLPFSRITHFRGVARAVVPTRMLRMHRDHFSEMLQRIPVLGQRLVALMSDRIREAARIETQQEKLAALGKLSAGLAHELNNPAAAARRAAQSMGEALENVRSVSVKLMKHPFSDAQREAILQFEREAGQQTTSRESVAADPLEVSDREERITEWLERRQMEEPWTIAAILAEAGVTTQKLDALENVTTPPLVGYVLRRVAAIVNIYELVQEIDNSTRRISDLVTAIKRYSYMDQMPIQEVDLREDIDNTLKIFGHRLKSGITLTREYDPELPRVCAYGGELNQVWTNLIDNAIDAMKGKGELRIRTSRERECAVVEITDNGPGIPPEIQSRIFDPFFTTKPVGEGTGLGLDTAMRIVRKHHGSIEVKSHPGETSFRVRLPFKQPTLQSEPPQPASATS
jgi:signal transduction histidine kinase